jgi:hypothetical protein
VLSDPGRPRPLSQSPDADISSLLPHRFDPWRNP